MRKKAISLLSLLCSLLLTVLPAFSVSGAVISCETYDGTNVEAQNYSRWASPIESYLTTCQDGTLMRVQFLNSTQGVLIEYYDSSYNLLRNAFVAPELPLFGGFYETADNYYLLTGQTNADESAQVEVFRITKYDKSWNRIASAGLYNCNTTVPFDAGSARFAQCGKYLLIRTSHEMYQSSDGKNHQANVTIELDTEAMTITDSYTGVMNSKYGYASHSFNQFIQMENNRIVAVDHGDAYPRSIALFEYATDASTGKFVPTYYTGCTVTDLLAIPGTIGNNTTGATIGGFEISDNAYLVAGNSVIQDSENTSRSTRNIFIIAKDKTTSEVRTNWITNYTEGEASTNTPQFVKLPDSNYLLLWSRSNEVFWTKIDGNGNQIGEIYSMEGNLSDCVPVVSGNKLIWYTWNYKTNTFYDIDLNNLSSANVTSITNGHNYEVQSVTDGNATLYCDRCGTTTVVGVPTSTSVWWNYEGGSGYYYSNLRSRNVGEDLYWWITYSSNGDFNDMVIEVGDPSMVSVEYTRQDHTMGKMTMLKGGTTTIKIYPEGNPGIAKTYTLTIIPPTITLTYDANGGTGAPDAQIINAGEPFDLSTAIPVRSGYTFDGWYTAAEGGSQITSDTVLQTDTTLYAHWSKVAAQPVTGLTATYENGQIVLHWDDCGAVQYKISRTDGTSGYKTLTYKAQGNTYTDTDFIPAQLYYYRISGYFLDEEDKLTDGPISEACAVVATDRLPDKVVNVTASVSDGKVTLNWDKTEGARYYKISRATGATGKYYCMKYNLSDTVYTDSTVSKNTYRYKVVGYYKDTDGSWVYGDLSDTLYVTVK